MKTTLLPNAVVLVALALTTFNSAHAQSSASADAAASGSAGIDDEQAKAAALAKATLNPIASLISLPIQNNFDWGGGPNDDGFQYKLTVQPVIPISLNENWNVISRTIVPYIYQERRLPEALFGKSQSGLADTVQSLFFSPVKPAAGGWIWGAGPVLQIPTATDDVLGEEKWGAGPTAVVLKQEGPVTFGALVYQVWSFAGEEDRADISRSFVQPFVSYTTKTFTSFGLNAESTYDWENEQWTVPINAYVQQMLKVGNQPITVQLGYRYYAEGPSEAPDWGLRFQISFLFPK
jgi:hypothetical protein